MPAELVAAGGEAVDLAVATGLVEGCAEATGTLPPGLVAAVRAGSGRLEGAREGSSARGAVEVALGAEVGCAEGWTGGLAGSGAVVTTGAVGSDPGLASSEEEGEPAVVAAMPQTTAASAATPTPPAIHTAKDFRPGGSCGAAVRAALTMAWAVIPVEMGGSAGGKVDVERGGL